ncbi:hypothetical protein Scep_016790 [Stephania cephalantha]|uniref:Uncharacterized protein n=1 Tax=Stephania cephalantha TaxID=152367 RepID=A0AAP0IQ93_9MAGN
MYMSFRVIGEAYTSTLGVSLIDGLVTFFYIHAFLDSFRFICMNSTALDIVNCCFGYCEMLCICPTGFTYLGSSFLCLTECRAADE